MRPTNKRTGINRGYRLLLGSCLTAIVALSTTTSTQAKVLHKYLPPQITSVPGEPGITSSGKPTGVFSMTVDDGELFATETTVTGDSRADVYDASSMRFLAQFPVASGQLRVREGIGVSDTFPERRAYVGGKGLVAVYTESTPQKWELTTTWSGSATPAKQFCTDTACKSIAVDQSANVADWAKGDVYATDADQGIVDVFEPKANPEEEVLVAQIEGTGPGKPFAHPYQIAVDQATGDIAVDDEMINAYGENENVVDLFAPESNMPGVYRFLFTLSGLSPSRHFRSISSVAFGSGGAAAGNIFVAANTIGDEQVGVYEFGPTGNLLDSLTGAETPEGTFTPNRASGPTAIAVDPLSPDDVFVSPRYYPLEGKEYAVVDRFGDDVVVPDVSTASGPEVRLDSSAHAWVAAVGGSVNPADAGPATCAFSWGVDEAFDQSSSCVGPGEADEPIPNGSTNVSVTGDLTNLSSDSTFEYRLQASNANGSNEGESSEDVSFRTPGPGIHGVWSAGVSSGAARLLADIDPDEAVSRPHPVSYFFEYGPSASYGSMLPGGVVGPGSDDVRVQGEARGLAASSVYHYRVVVTAEVEAEPTAKPGVFAIERFYGPDQTLTTQASVSTGPVLPDGRAWELVSPPNKHGGLIGSLNQLGLESVVQASVGGNAISYASFSPIEEGVAGNDSAVRDQIYSRHGPNGWFSQGLVPPHASEVGINLSPEYQFFSEDLSQGLLAMEGEDQTLLSTYASEPTPYLREQAACEEPARAESECYLPLLSGMGDYADVRAGAKFGEAKAVRFEDATGDMNHVILASSNALTEVQTDGDSELYEWSRDAPPSERLRLISMLPTEEGGGPATGFSVKPGNDPYANWASGPQAITSEGNRIFWEMSVRTLTENGANLYMRDVGKGETVKLNVPAPGVEPGVPDPRFQGMNEDGSVAYFTDSERLTADASKSGADLYECQIVEEPGGLKCDLTDLTPEGADGPSEVQNVVLGSSTDGSYIYFVADGRLGSTAPRGICRTKSTIAGTCNLFMYHEGTTSLVATLSTEDETDWAEQNSALHRFGSLTARVSPDGRFAVFMSSRSLTGYDNVDAVSGMPDQEVYLYDAVNSRLACVSCNPSGARPEGIEARKASLTTLVRQAEQYALFFSRKSWVAASIPTGDELAGYGESLYMPRVLFNSGRVFFDSRDALVPGDVNHEEDVYEYEPVGVPAGRYACSTASATYSDRDDGCVSLISSGRAAGGAGFLDASASGDDVFFVTAEPLVGKDVDTAIDVYDAHVCGAGWECAAETAPVPACASSDACRGAPAPQPAVFGAPASATFSGPGSQEPSSSQAREVKKRSLTRAQKLARALKACKSKHFKARRKSCEQETRKRYGRVARRARANGRGAVVPGARRGVSR